MPDYGDILRFLARNPPQIAAERDLHASLLELLAKCLRDEKRTPKEERSAGMLPLANENNPNAAIADSHERWVHLG